MGFLGVAVTICFSNTPITATLDGLCEIGHDIASMLETIIDRLEHLCNRFSTAFHTNLAFGCIAGSMVRETAISEIMKLAHVLFIFAKNVYEFWIDSLCCTSTPLLLIYRIYPLCLCLNERSISRISNKR